MARVNGSHHIMRHPDGRGTTVPVHGTRDLTEGTLRGILNDVGLTIDELAPSGRADDGDQIAPDHAGIRLAATVAPSSQQASWPVASTSPTIDRGSRRRFHFSPVAIVSTLLTAPVVSEPPCTYKA